MKKIISILVALCMIISALPAFAYFANDVAIPELGVLNYLDFENCSTTDNVAYTLQSNYGGPMYYANGYVTEQNGNKYFTHAVANSKISYGIRDRVNGIADAITTGVLRLQYDVRVPYPEGINTDNNIYYMINNVDTFDRAFLNTVTSDLDGAKIHFAEAIHDGAKPNEGADYTATKEIEFDKWYTITMVIDYDNGRVLQFLDGTRVAGFLQTPDKVAKYLGFNNAGLALTAAPELRSDFIQVDNFLVERIDNDKINASVTKYGKNYVDVEFDGAVLANDSFTATNFILKNLDGSDAVKPESLEKLSVSKFRLTFAEDLVEGATYEIAINATVVEAGTNLEMPKGKKIFFNIPKSGESLIDLNFNDKENHFATAENSAEFDTYYYQSKSETDTSTSFATQKDLTDDYATITSRGDGETGSNFRILQFKHSPTGPDYQSLVFPFADNKSINSGKIAIEFEAMLEGTVGTVGGAFEVAYGLRDTKNTATEFDYSSTWTNATVFAGHETWSGQQKDLTPGLEGKRSKPSTWYDGSTGVVAGNQASDWKDAHRLAQLNYTGKTNTTPMDKYKIVVDLDNDFFEIYFNDTLKYTSTYMPGGINDGEYDAFVLTTVHGNSDYYNYFYFDNLKVSYEASTGVAFAIDSAEFTVGSEKAVYAPTVDYTATEMTIKMTDGVSPANIEANVTFSGSDVHEVFADRDAVTIIFPNGLTPGKDYTVTLSGNLASSNGATLGSDMVLSFKAAAPEIKYGTPVITYDGFALPSPVGIEPGLELAASVNAKAGVSCSAFMMLASYKEGKLAGVFLDTVTSDTGVLTLKHVADDRFVGADVVKAFVFESATSLKPLAAPAVIGE